MLVAKMLIWTGKKEAKPTLFEFYLVGGLMDIEASGSGIPSRYKQALELEL